MFKLWTKQDFRAFLATNFTAFFMLSVLLIMISLVSIVILLGMQHLWPRDIYLVEYQQYEQPVKIYGELNTKWQQQLNEDEKLVVSFPDPHRVAFNQLEIPTTSVHHVSIISQVYSWHLATGNIKFARQGRLFIDDVEQTHLTLNQALNDVKQIEEKISGKLNRELIEIHKQIALLKSKGVASNAPLYQTYNDKFEKVDREISELRKMARRYEVELVNASEQSERVSLHELERYVKVNQLGIAAKVVSALSNFGRLLVQSPQSNFQAGGFFPAIFGTVTMVLLMTLFVTPLGVLVAVYLHEYAPRSWVTHLIRIGVNNLAGVPSIVYGVFGLGFFVYGLGGSIDQLLYAEHLPSPTFGSPGLLWASLTMAFLTLPVVIVATEEGLNRVPRNLMVGSYALGATKFESVWRIGLPLASPGILTGIIMAMARGAGEVAPLLLVGVVKFAPLLPVDGQYPYVHLERQFMHLGSLIYHGTFNSSEADFGGSMIFVSCMLLLLLVLCLNLMAISVRNKLRLRYSTMENE